MSSSLVNIGKILALIGGILAVISGSLRLLGDLISLSVPNVPGVTNDFGFVGDQFIGAIIQIIVGVLLIYVYTGKIGSKDGLVLSIIVIVLGLVASSLFAIIGGILILIDYLS